MNTHPKNFPACHSSDRNRAALAILILTVLGLGWWCNARADTLLFEGFEGNFPLDNGWSVGDSNSAGTSAFWDDVSAPFGTADAHAGNRKGYCAGIGFAGAAAAPLYQTNMDAYLRRTLDLRSYCSSSLSFWCRTPAIETCCAYLIVSLGGTVVFSNATPTVTWSNVVVNLSAWAGGVATLDFTFHSDASVTQEGVYLDDLEVTAAPALATLNPGAISWGAQQDADGDGCLTAPSNTFRLNWDVDVSCPNTNALSGFEKIYRRPCGTESWTLYQTTTDHPITSVSGADQQFLDLPASSGCACYDYAIEAYRSGELLPDSFRDPASNPILGGHQEETLSEEIATLFGAYWTYQQDRDGDGCLASTNNIFQLVYDPDVAGCRGTLTVFEKVYSQACGADDWTLLTTTSNHVISGCLVDASYVDLPVGSNCACFNYLIEVYRAGQAVPDYALGPTNYLSVLANHSEEPYLLDECSLATATIRDAWWSSAVDTDGNNCWEATAPTGFHLNWDTEVSVGGNCTLSVFERIYLRTCGNPAWSLLTNTPPHSITGAGFADQQLVNLPPGADCTCHEYLIEAYRSGQLTPDSTRDPGNDPDLANHSEEALNHPSLTITLAGTDLVLSWPATFVGFTLQRASVLPSGSWSTATPAPVISGSQWVVTNAITSRTFYRLMK